MYSLFSFSALALAAAAVFLAFYVSPDSRAADFAAVKIGGARVFAEVADGADERKRGLGGRESLADGEGMLFVFPYSGRHSFWMKGMKFPIDIFWIKNGRVADIAERAAPFSEGTPDKFLPVYRPDVPARFILETPAGFAARNGIAVGTRVSILRRQFFLRK